MSINWILSSVIPYPDKDGDYLVTIINSKNIRFMQLVSFSNDLSSINEKVFSKYHNQKGYYILTDNLEYKYISLYSIDTNYGIIAWSKVLSVYQGPIYEIE